MKRQAYIDAMHGGRTTHFETPCGIEVVLNRYPNGDMKTKFWFMSQPFQLGEGCPYALSSDGAVMLGKEIGVLYGASDDDFKDGVGL